MAVFNRKKDKGEPVFIVDGSRTPFLKTRGKPGPFKALDLAIQATRPLLMRNGIGPGDIDEVVVGCVSPEPDECNIARLLALRLGLSHSVPAHTVQRNCASGMQAVDTAFRSISHGYSDLILVGGTEAMSHAPLILNDKMTRWFSAFAGARSFPAKIKLLLKLRPDFLMPVIGLLKALTDPTLNISMGQTAENLCHRFGITKEEMDSFALQSHNRLAAAQDANVFDSELTTIYDKFGKVYNADDGLRRDNTIEKLGRLRPAFDRKFGNITAGNSAQITDGASFMILASEGALRKHEWNGNVVGKIVDSNWAGVDPAEMGIGPAHAIAPMVKRNKLDCVDIQSWEINEAFAAQVLSCIKALGDEEYCKNSLGLSKAFGNIPLNKVNANGGGVSMGHPVGASGSRIVYHLAKTLVTNKERYGVASLCIGHGQGGAMLIENTQL
jgi:acetyl-CoA C-acetyltransferase